MRPEKTKIQIAIERIETMRRELDDHRDYDKGKICAFGYALQVLENLREQEIGKIPPGFIAYMEERHGPDWESKFIRPRVIEDEPV